jgi:acetyl-CoA carboxylase biotin carboxyl carrier protein
VVDVKEIKKIYQIFMHEGIDNIEIQNGEDRVSFSIGKIALSKKEVLANQQADVKLAEQQAVLDKAEETKIISNIYELKSNWIGFFTRLNPKTGESYLKLRDVVKKGDIVGHVRVLGVLQDLRVENGGKLKEVLIEEGQPIEYGQPVMRFEMQ